MEWNCARSASGTQSLFLQKSDVAIFFIRMGNSKNQGFKDTQEPESKISLFYTPYMYAKKTSKRNAQRLKEAQFIFEIFLFPFWAWLILVP